MTLRDARTPPLEFRRAAERISLLMGVTGRAVLTRLLGIILAALAVQFVIDGVQSQFG